MKSLRNICAVVFTFISCSAGAQKYNFVNWTVEDGLIQSQAMYVCQDHYRQLWVGTEGGLSCFDGKKFNGFTVKEGLVANHINTILSDSRGHLWAGTNYGLALFDGGSFRTVKFSDGALHNITSIINARENIFTLSFFNSLYRVDSLQATKIVVSGDSSERITTLYSTPSGQAMVYVYGKGLYVQNRQWQRVMAPAGAAGNGFLRRMFITSERDTLLLFNRGLHHLVNGKPEMYPIDKIQELLVLCIAEDERKQLWLGTDNGAYKIQDNELIHFDSKSGLTDNQVNHIIQDVENNLWFATDGDGIYKFRENTFTYYDKSSGLANTIIMGVVQTTDGKIYAGGYGGGLYTINAKHDIEPVKKSGNYLADARINSLYADDENNVWIGTLGKGVFRYNIRSGVVKTGNGEMEIPGANSFLKDRHGNMLLGGNRGIFIIGHNGKTKHLAVPGAIVTSLKQLNNDSVLVATSKGLYVVTSGDSLQPYLADQFGNASALCLAISNSSIWMGTTDRGILTWNFKTKQLLNYNTAHGLPSNFIYSIDASGKNTVWTGTGYGISNLITDETGKIRSLKNYGRSEGLLGMECSHNCLLHDRDSGLWFGTTKGLFHFNPASAITEKNQPLVLLKSVKLFSSQITDTSLFKRAGTWFGVPEGLSLYSKQNHLTFELGSIYFTNPEDVMYSYMLEGIDKGFTTSSNPVIIYPALPPGRYNLLVRGITKSGLGSVNTIHYPFEIKKAFYQTSFFQALVIFILISTGALITWLVTRGRQQRKQKAKELMARIREEEFKKLRQRTAEDFHDEMGNSLTRISILTDILKSRINGHDEDVSRLVQQIKENTTALYNGSRDIIWSLNSQNDGIYEIAEHIKEIGHDVFGETSVEFSYTHNIEPRNPLKLKLDYSRNLTMIFKEAYSNILRHAGAGRVEISMELKNENELEISVKDDGTGFDQQQKSSGNGIRNMQNRVQRMHGEFNLQAVPGGGTGIHIRLKSVFVN